MSMYPNNSLTSHPQQPMGAVAFSDKFTIELAEIGSIAGPFRLNGRRLVRVDIKPESGGTWAAGILKLVYRLAPGCEYRDFVPQVLFSAGTPYTPNPIDCAALNEVFVQVSTVNATAAKALVHFSREA